MGKGSTGNGRQEEKTTRTSELAEFAEELGRIVDMLKDLRGAHHIKDLVLRHKHVCGSMAVVQTASKDRVLGSMGTGDLDAFRDSIDGGYLCVLACECLLWRRYIVRTE